MSVPASARPYSPSRRGDRSDGVWGREVITHRFSPCERNSYVCLRQGATLVRLPRPFPFALCLQHAGCTSNFPSSNFLTPSCGRSRRETACPWQTARVCDDAVARGRVSSVLAPGLLRWTVCGLRYTLILVPPRGSRTIAYPDSATRHCAPGSSLPLGVLQLACVDDESFGHYLRYKNGSYIKQRRFSDRPA